MAHTKKSNMPTTWPVARKTRTARFIAVPQHAKTTALNLLFVMRDILGIAKTKKEAKKILHQGDVKVNNKVRKEETFPVQILDTISLEKSDNYYRLEIVNRKFFLKEIKKNETSTKIVKISGKKFLSKDKVQMNLEDGTNLISKEKFSLGDSVILNSEKNTIDKILPLKEKAKVEIISGKHAGEKGELVEIIPIAKGNTYKIKLKESEVTLPYKTILVIG